MKHIAIMPDGNRRWARARGMELTEAYLFAANRVERICEWAIEHGIPYTTFHIFTTENWRRSAADVSAIMDAVHDYLTLRGAWYIQNGVRLEVIGRRDRLEERIVRDIEQIEERTRDGKRLTLFLCADYSGRDEIARAVAAGARTEEELSRAIMGDTPEPDLILRTGGQHRLSGFMLWQAAYTELYFMDKLFPDLSASDLDNALEWFNSRIRNFGK